MSSDHPLKLHLRFVRLGPRAVVVTLRHDTSARFSTNLFHDTRHILTGRDGAGGVLARLLWGLSFQKHESTFVVIDREHLTAAKEGSMRRASDSLVAMKRLVVVLFAFAFAPEQKASHVEVAPLPTPATETKAAPGGGGPPGDDMRLVVHEGSGDRDGDGVADAIDKCPDDPEDFDGFEDEDGCPDPDNDRDGIPDVQDQCPNVPGPPPSGCPKSRP